MSRRKSRRPHHDTQKCGFSVEDFASQCKRILRSDVSLDSRAKTSSLVFSALESLDDELKRLASNSPNASQWFDGTGCVQQIELVTRHFHDAGWVKAEERASSIWCRLVLTVAPDYRDLVGPAMISNASCHHRMGNLKRATELWECIVRDFACNAHLTSNGDDAIASQALVTAAVALRRQGIECVDEIRLQDLEG